MSNPTSAEELSTSSYWDKRYADVGPTEQVHEWFKTFSELEPFLEQHLFSIRGPDTEPKILHLGSGDSTVPEELASRGYRYQLCVDFSTVVVDTMQQKHAHIDGITWKQLDVRQMDQIQTESIDIAFDKGTLDAMIYGSPWSPPDDVVKNTSRYIKEVCRVLNHNGTFLYITYRQPHFVKPLLECDGTAWKLEIVTLGNAGSFDYYGFVLKKFDSARAGTQADMLVSS